jgi:hypothetical protein
MGQLRITADEPAIVASPREIGVRGNVVPFATRRRASPARSGSAARQPSDGVVVRLALAKSSGRGSWPRTEVNIAETRSKTQSESSRSTEQRFTPFDMVATAFLVLSVLAVPALVWTLLRSATFG